MNKMTYLSAIIDNDESLRTYLNQLEHTNMTLLSERDARIVGNYRLALSIAAEYMNQGLEPADVFGFAMQGLTMAADHYNPESGKDFAPYAIRWIQGAVCAALTDVSHTIRIPKRIREMLKETPEDEVSQWLLTCIEPMDSLDRYAGKDGDRTMTLGDTIAAEEEDDAVRERVERILNQVSGQEREVLERYYIHGEDCQTIGRAMHLSAARVRQIRRAGLKG